MKKRIGLLGYGKIGQAVAADILSREEHVLSFIQDKFSQPQPGLNYPFLREQRVELLKQTDLVVECALAEVLKEEAPEILKYCDLLPFSLTAFSDEAFYKEIVKICRESGHHVYIPHGAVLGLDGIADAGELLEEVRVETVKPPKALKRTDMERTVLYDGPTRGACQIYSRNVNVHAGLALAGVGFDRMHSVIISDPDVDTNTHYIHVKGKGFRFDITVSSTSGSGVTGAYTPLSACGSLLRALGTGEVFCVV